IRANSERSTVRDVLGIQGADRREAVRHEFLYGRYGGGIRVGRIATSECQYTTGSYAVDSARKPNQGGSRSRVRMDQRSRDRSGGVPCISRIHEWSFGRYPFDGAPQLLSRE